MTRDLQHAVLILQSDDSVWSRSIIQVASRKQPLTIAGLAETGARLFASGSRRSKTGSLRWAVLWLCFYLVVAVVTVVAAGDRRVLDGVQNNPSTLEAFSSATARCATSYLVTPPRATSRTASQARARLTPSETRFTGEESTTIQSKCGADSVDQAVQSGDCRKDRRPCRARCRRG